MARPGEGHQDHQEDVTLSAWRGRLEEARLTLPGRGAREEMTRDVSEGVIVATVVSIIILAFVFVSVAWTCPECMPWHRPDARHILW